MGYNFWHFIYFYSLSIMKILSRKNMCTCSGTCIISAIESRWSRAHLHFTTRLQLLLKRINLQEYHRADKRRKAFKYGKSNSVTVNALGGASVQRRSWSWNVWLLQGRTPRAVSDITTNLHRVRLKISQSTILRRAEMQTLHQKIQTVHQPHEA